MGILKLCWDEGEESRMFGMVPRAEPGLDTGCGFGMSGGCSCYTSWRDALTSSLKLNEQALIGANSETRQELKSDLTENFTADGEWEIRKGVEEQENWGFTDYPTLHLQNTGCLGTSSASGSGDNPGWKENSSPIFLSKTHPNFLRAKTSQALKTSEAPYNISEQLLASFGCLMRQKDIFKCP
ncbi:hypothetical protein DUI87_04751 [Hirundo rustica rustica]|uniref:Uncharacterized protein n=1 Tax=Hirundo rustica rustica TaxID=333673 RepID=A0A3M0L0C9_HIRRU|nr:hypothetical protein DUI87_04751 [Hirundo rustica rustica]